MSSYLPYSGREGGRVSHKCHSISQEWNCIWYCRRFFSLVDVVERARCLIQRVDIRGYQWHCNDYHSCEVRKKP